MRSILGLKMGRFAAHFKPRNAAHFGPELKCKTRRRSRLILHFNSGARARTHVKHRRSRCFTCVLARAVHVKRTHKTLLRSVLCVRFTCTSGLRPLQSRWLRHRHSSGRRPLYPQKESEAKLRSRELRSRSRSFASRRSEGPECSCGAFRSFGPNLPAQGGSTCNKKARRAFLLHVLPPCVRSTIRAAKQPVWCFAPYVGPSGPLRGLRRSPLRGPEGPTI